MDLKLKREMLGLTQKQIAEELQCSEKAICFIETGKLSESVSQKYNEFITHNIFEKTALKLSESVSETKEVVSIKHKFSKTNLIYTYKVELSLRVAEIKYIEFEEKFVVTHKPIKAEHSELAEETRIAYKICKVLNHKLKER